MTLRGYVKKGKPANWLGVRGAKPVTTAIPPGVPQWHRIRPVAKSKAEQQRAYRKDASAFVEAAVAREEKCPVVTAIEELRTGTKYGHPISANLTQVHHTRGRLGILLRDQRFWLAVSRIGHRWIHSNVEEARRRGWICAAGDWNKQPD